STCGRQCPKLNKETRFGADRMTQSEFHQLLDSINTLSPEQIQQLRRELDSKLDVAATEPASVDEALQRRLVDAGLLSEIKPPIRIRPRTALRPDRRPGRRGRLPCYFRRP